MNRKEITRRDFLYGSAAAAIAFSLGTGMPSLASPRKRRPNIVMIIADDLGYGDVGYHGSTTVRTPHIDALASGGVRFTSGYVAAAVCSPSRAGLITGRYPQRHGFEFNSGQGLSPREVTLGNLMKGAGYVTGMVGKWHLGHSEGLTPLARGFDESYGTHGGGTLYATSRTPDIVTVPPRKLPLKRRRPIYRGNKEVVEDTYITDAFTREGIDFIMIDSSGGRHPTVRCARGNGNCGR
jgi:arylsulfatase A-like enzyme